ncbi:MAG TPA: EAL domain-containing protein [Candidatus Limnocylindrales bacterium]|nr:EAL domain-containing protein [Candidatus Limnocylindrales bacterium]
MTDRGKADALRRALRIFGWIVLPLGVAWSPVGVALNAPAMALSGLIAAGFGAWLLIESKRAPGRSESDLALRIATGGQITAVLIAAAEPTIGFAVAVGSLIPIILALPYVRRESLTTLMAVSAAVGAFSLAAPSILPWGSTFEDSLAFAVPTGAVVVVYVLLQLFLWNASTRLTDTTSELRHVIQMSHDLAATLDPKDVGHRLARHIAQVAHADACVLSTWDREGDRVVTFGSHPLEARGGLEPAYQLSDYPATRRVLERHEPYVLTTDDPTADAAEVDYLREIGHRSLAMLPLIVRDESIGIVELTSTRPSAFAERDVELAQLLVREAAVTFENARLTDELRHMAYRDPLTGLANRSRLQDRVDHALARLRGRSPNRAAVLFIDLDHFKHLNDRFGHAKGDRALQVIGDRIRSIIRPGDTAGRLGGDEFAILLEDVDSIEVVQQVCQRLIHGLSQPIELGDAAPIVGASIGYALSDGVTSSEDLLRQADTAMYAAKAAGRGQVIAFRQELLDNASARSELAALLRGAEARNELKLHFQPVVNLDDGSPVGVEALVRWQPDGHLLHLPADFIELAEETGDILPIGRWVISEACRKVRAWQTRYDMPNLRLYVNLAARQFRDPGVVPMIVSALARTGLDAGSLTLEITEGTLLTPGFETVQRIGELRALGLRLAIDDFGTGYSSLGYLHAFQIDELKIDRSFVPGSEGVGDAHVLSQAIVELGRALGLDMIVEGIESQDQADWFRTLGCRLGQGYLFARPLPSGELDRFLRLQQPGGGRRRAVAEGGVPLPLGTARFPTAGITDVVGARKAAG